MTICVEKVAVTLFIYLFLLPRLGCWFLDRQCCLELLATATACALQIIETPICPGTSLKIWKFYVATPTKEGNCLTIKKKFEKNIKMCSIYIRQKVFS